MCQFFTLHQQSFILFFFEASESKENILLRPKVYKAEYIAWAKKEFALKKFNISPQRISQIKYSCLYSEVKVS